MAPAAAALAARKAGEQGPRCQSEYLLPSDAGGGGSTKGGMNFRNGVFRQPEVDVDIEVRDISWQPIGPDVPHQVVGHTWSPRRARAGTLLQAPLVTKCDLPNSRSPLE